MCYFEAIHVVYQTVIVIGYWFSLVEFTSRPAARSGHELWIVQTTAEETLVDEHGAL